MKSVDECIGEATWLRAHEAVSGRVSPAEWIRINHLMVNTVALMDLAGQIKLQVVEELDRTRLYSLIRNATSMQLISISREDLT